MKKGAICDLIKHHTERNNRGFWNIAIQIAEEFEKSNNHDEASAIKYYISLANMDRTEILKQINYEHAHESIFLQPVCLDKLKDLYFPKEILNDLHCIPNAINNNIDINRFLFEGAPGTGKTEAAKYVAKLLDRNLFYVSFDGLIDSKLGQTGKNVSELFRQIRCLSNPEKAIILFDEIDVIAMDRISNNDMREMGRVTSIILREFDRLTEHSSELIIIATTNLYKFFDKALKRRFDATFNFDRYQPNDLIKVGIEFFNMYAKKLKNIPQDDSLAKEIIEQAILKNTINQRCSPGELQNAIKTALAFSNPNITNDYITRLRKNLILDAAAELANSKQVA
jgi:SpoVK/Ycf46/Vps4 family AAA+-type ATPase